MDDDNIQDHHIPITHAQRHPELIVQPAVERKKKKKLTEGQQASLAIGRAVAEENRTTLNIRLLEFVADQDKRLEQIAEEEGVTLEHCRRLLSTSLKAKRATSSQNALVSLKAFELNGDRPPGQKARLPEIRAAVAADESMQNATEEDIQKAKELLDEKRLARAQGARGSHVSEAKDISAFSRKTGEEVFNLFQRTGAVSFGFVTRGDIDCTGTPCWWASGNAAEFVKEKLNQGMWDLLRSFESWAVANSGGPAKGPSNMNDRKKACAAIIASNLVYITRSKDIQMSYANYDREIVVAEKVHIIGWPPQVAFSAPSTLTRSGDVRDLLDALQSGACRWAKVSKKELDEAKARVALQQPKERRVRSDAGGSHAKRKQRKRKGADANDDDGDDQGHEVGSKPPQKRRRISKPKPPAFSSAEHVSDDEDDED
ncbi:hypothetical protein C8J56DRAFT_1118683 [Mycena floridula]|nr:hypothetical protein C8J56DRAFT_1118683 [Mycena floridula]